MFRDTRAAGSSGVEYPVEAVDAVQRVTREPFSNGTQVAPNAFDTAHTNAHSNINRVMQVGVALQSVGRILQTEVRTSDAFVTVQAWEGTVVDVDDEDIYVKIVDKTDRSRPDSVTTLSLSEVDEDDRDLVKEGAIFYWVIGYEKRASGKKRSSFIRFRRSPHWTKKNILEVERRADELLQRFAAFDVRLSATGSS